MSFINMKRISGFCIVILIFCTFNLNCFAHDLWIEPDDFTPEKGKRLSMKLAYDHVFPAEDLIEDNNLKEVYLLTPGGKKMDIIKGKGAGYETSQVLKGQGAYLVVSAQKPRFWTKTIEGYKSDHSKKGLENVISCTYSIKFGKGIVNAGRGNDSSILKPVGHDLEIVPLVNSSALKPGDVMPVKLMFKGKPLASTYIHATYKGFSEEKDTYAYTTKTNADGEAKIKMLKKGQWLIATSYNEDYQDRSECDTIKFSATLTFEID